jgi:hypothetical protein
LAISQPIGAVGNVLRRIGIPSLYYRCNTGCVLYAQ